MGEILVIGDSCTDVFQYGICERLSPEAPVPIFKSTTLTTNGGMAINVANNVRALKYDCDIITNDKRPCKTRYIDEISNQMLLRVDGNDDIKQLNRLIFNSIKFEEYDAIIISDYDKGFLDKDMILEISQKHPLVFMDTKKKLDLWAENIKFIKINQKEFNKNAGREFLERYQHYLIITMGDKGAALNRSTGYHQKVKEFPIENGHAVRDLTGAGDTFLASLAVKYLENKDVEEAINFANKCSSWVVTQKGVVPINLKEI